jgi:hypothetical protein
MPPKQKALWMMSTYNGEYVQFLAQAQKYYDPQTTDAQRAVLRWKRKLLSEAYHLIASYIEKIESGENPVKLENQIIGVLNSLLSAEETGPPPEEPVVEEPSPSEPVGVLHG